MKDTDIFWSRVVSNVIHRVGYCLDEKHIQGQDFIGDKQRDRGGPGLRESTFRRGSTDFVLKSVSPQAAKPYDK